MTDTTETILLASGGLIIGQPAGHDPGEAVAARFDHTPTDAEIAAALATVTPDVDRLRAHAAAKRWMVETGGIVVDGATIDTSRESQALINGAHAYAQAQPSAEIRFKAASGWVTLDAAAITTIAMAVAAHVQAAFAVEAEVDAAIVDGTITTTAAIDAAAWPSNG